MGRWAEVDLLPEAEAWPASASVSLYGCAHSTPRHPHPPLVWLCSCSGPTARDELLGVLEGALPESNKRGVRMNKTSLGRLPVDQLRQLAARLDLDSRGRKEEVVARLLLAVAEEEHWEAGPPPDSFRPG